MVDEQLVRRGITDPRVLAAMRKLLTILNAMVKHQQPWQPIHVEN